MRKTNVLKKATPLFLAITLLVTSSGFAINKEEVLTVSDERMDTIQSTLAAYFDARSHAVNNSGISTLSLQDADTFSVPSDIATDMNLRAQALTDFWANEDVEIVSTTTSEQLLSANLLQDSMDINAVVYEWTWIDYIDGDSPVTDLMGFATVHDMTLELADDGIYQVSRDSYDESDVSGHTSADYDRATFEQAVEGISTAAAYSNALAEKNIEANETNLSLNSVNTAVPAANANNLDVFRTIIYADKWVVHDISKTADANTAYYNTEEFDSYDSDCCNYVSQCLDAGGLARNDTWKPGEPAWISVSTFTNFWKQSINGGYAELSITDSNVLPGNPVYYFGTQNHIAICVGYNSAGSPIINGHTRDVYHQKLSSVYKYTMQFNTTNSFIVNPQGATTLTMPGTYNGLYLQAGKGEWFKFVAPSSGYYTVHTTGNTDTYGFLFQETHGSSKGDTIYFYELYSNDDGIISGDGKNCRVGAQLTAGQTYYVMICAALVLLPVDTIWSCIKDSSHYRNLPPKA